MQRCTVYLYLETALHVSDGTITHYQENIQLYVQHLVFVTPFLLPAAERQVEETLSRASKVHHPRKLCSKYMLIQIALLLVECCSCHGQTATCATYSIN